MSDETPAPKSRKAPQAEGGDAPVDRRCLRVSGGTQSRRQRDFSPYDAAYCRSQSRWFHNTPLSSQGLTFLYARRFAGL